MYRNYSSLVGLGLSEQVQGKPVYLALRPLYLESPVQTCFKKKKKKKKRRKKEKESKATCGIIQLNEML